MISHAQQDVKAYYDAAWAACAADDLLVATAALQADFSPAEPPRCALPEGATVEALVALARDTTVKVWDVATGECVATLVEYGSGVVWRRVFSVFLVRVCYFLSFRS